MYGSGTQLLLRSREARQGSFGFGKTNAFKPKRLVVLFLAIAAAFMIVSDGSAADQPGAINAINIEGAWAYTAKCDHGGIEHIATTRAAEDNIWFLVACSPDDRLTVSLLHPEQFPFPLKASS